MIGLRFIKALFVSRDLKRNDVKPLCPIKEARFFACAYARRGGPFVWQAVIDERTREAHYVKPRL